MLAISDNETILYKIYDGAVKSLDWIQFLYQLVTILNESGEAFCLVYDNLNVHYSRASTNLFVNKYINIKMAAYSSETNKIELAFNIIKRNY